jgi:beta-glucanase (GH16 family)
MTTQIVTRKFRQYATLLPLLALSVAFSGCERDERGGEPPALEPGADSFTVQEDTMLEGDVSVNDSVHPGRSYTAGAPANGVVDMAGDGTFTYMPNLDFFGDDSFTYTMTDSKGASATADVSITVTNVPDTLEEFGWTMVWSDEFEGTAVNDANWTPQIGDGTDITEADPPLPEPSWGNREEQWYLAENATVADGNLVITARQEEVVAPYPYTSARLRSKDKLDIKYGRVEARIKTPTGQGLWSAFWMLPTDSPYVYRPDPAGPLDPHWASSGEVDIMEVINAGTAGEDVFVTLHYGFPWPLNQLNGTPVDVAAPDEDFHTYAVEWDQDEFRWYVDGVHVLSVGSETYYNYYYGGLDTGYVAGAEEAPFDVDFHVLLNLAVGGNLPGDVAAETVFPAEMLVDYVRVYECSADTVTGTGCASFVDESATRPAADDVFVNTIDLYDDATVPLSWDVGGTLFTRDLGLSVLWDNGGAIVLSEVAAADASRGTVIDVNTIDKGNIGLFAADTEVISLYGMNNNPNNWELRAAELKFDLYIDSAGTDAASSLLVKMDSGFPALGTVDLPVADLPQDEWTTVSVRVNDLLANAGDQPLDTGAVVNLFVLEPTGMAHVQLDNIQLVCGHPGPNGCGVNAPSDAEPPPTGGGDPVLGQIYIDAPDPAWQLFDCCGGSVPSEVDSMDPAYDMVAQYLYLAAPTVAGFEAVAAGGEDLTSFAGGTLEFDVFLGTAPSATAPDPGEWFLKLEGPSATPALEVSLTASVEGVQPTVGGWQHYTFNLDDLGFPLDAVKLVMVFPTWGTGNGAVVWIDNVQFLPPPGQIFTESLGAGWSLFDCCGGSVPSEVDSMDPAYGNVAQYLYLAAPTVAGFEADAATGEDLSDFAGGTLEFDVFLATAPSATAPDPGEWFLKLEGPSATPATEVSLTTSAEGVQPTVGMWQHYTFDVDTLTMMGFDFSITKLVMVFPTWGTGNGAVVWLDNVKFVPAP